MKKAKIGDMIEWTMPIDSCSILSGKTYQGTVLMLDKYCYGVHTIYGFDLVPFEQATIINK